jgi:hypothetical protein
VAGVLLGFQPGEGEPVGPWAFAGRVHGESPIGIWLAVDTILAPNEEELAQEDQPIYLLRWEWLMRARLFLEAPREIPRIGFRPAE